MTGTPATANPAEALPARTTPTWEIEILLSGASVFALFQIYDSLQRGLFDLFERLSPDALGMWSTLGSYVQAGVLGLAIGFFAHLLIRAYWAAAVGLHSIDPTGSLGRTGTVGPAQRAMMAERWAKLPQRIAELDDLATLVFALSLGLAKVMAILVLIALVSVAIGSVIVMFGNRSWKASDAMMVVMGLAILPSLVAMLVDNQRGKKNLPPLRWTTLVLRPYAAMGLTVDANLGMQMMVHRISGGRRSFKGSAAIGVLMFVLMLAVLVVPTLQRVGVGALLKGEFPSLQPGQFEALRANHYLDRQTPGQTLRVPVIASEVAKGPYLRLFIPYVPHWHDAMLSECRAASASTVAPDAATSPRRDRERPDWRLDAQASAETLRCLAGKMPVSIDAQAVTEPWVFADDRRHDRRGFVVMIDLRRLEPGRHELAMHPPEASFGEDEPRMPWRIPFWL
ncbi:hypothetical protein [Silanimonas sp.]|uniref:hypothetical protein n=1 Tax=Silanimonas sp. TaxID=1929290 RepID=UPI0022BF472D|nr:hypothetical protein [Silanimonas sp.]MCZ8114812.1 hypothetical protein [Silanimonas sp.]